MRERVPGTSSADRQGHITSPPSTGSARSIVLATIPVALAITVFGALYGAAAAPLIGPAATIAMSLFVFSGALQFALVSLLAAGAGAPALLLTAATLNLRHIVLGAVLRPRLGHSGLRRAGLAWFLVDETFGFAVAAASDPRISERDRAVMTERTLLVSGAACYVAWQLGTLAGVLGGSLPAVTGPADAVFPVLFIGLASLAARSRSIVARAVAASAVTAVIAIAVPEARALAPVIAGVVVALPGRGGTQSRNDPR